MAAPSDSEKSSTDRLPPPKGALLAIFLIVLSDLLGFGLIIPALPFYARHYHASDLQVGFIFSIYSLCQMLAAPVLGLVSDRWGRRPVLVFSQLGSVVGYLILALATARQWMNPMTGLLLVYASRVIDGASGGNLSTAQAYVSDVTAPDQRAKGMGMLGAAFGIGFSIGPAVGGVLAAAHPSLPALAAAGFSLVAAVLTILRLQEPARHSHEMDDQTLGWLHPAKFIPILRSPKLMQLLGISFFSMFAFVMMESVFAIFLNDRFGFRELQVGGFFAFVGFIIIVVQGGLIGKLTQRFGEWPLVIAGPLMVATAMSLYVVIGWCAAIGVSLGVAMVLLAGLFNATGRSIQTPTLSSLVSQFADQGSQGTTFGLFQMLGSLARVLGPVVATAIYTWHTTSPFWLAGIIMLSVGLWAIVLHKQSARRPVSVAGASTSQPVSTNPELPQAPATND